MIPVILLSDWVTYVRADYRDSVTNESHYLPWYNAVKLLDRVTGGHWDYAITNIHTTSDRLILTARITIHAAEGCFTREATGTETLTEEYFDKTTQTKQIREWAYGDVASKSESMALRRAAAKFGLGLYLYNRD